jgi:hypothetical protein
MRACTRAGGPAGWTAGQGGTGPSGADPASRCPAATPPLPALPQEREAAEHEAAKLRQILEETRLDNQKKLRERRKEVRGRQGPPLVSLLAAVATATPAPPRGGLGVDRTSPSLAYPKKPPETPAPSTSPQQLVQVAGQARGGSRQATAG